MNSQYGWRAWRSVKWFATHAWVAVVYLCYVKLKKGNTLQTKVKKWFRDKNYGFLDNGEGPDIMVRKADLKNCQYLRIGVTVEFDVYAEKTGLVAKRVKLSGNRNNNQNNRQNYSNNGNTVNGNNQRNYGNNRPFRPGVMT